MITIKVFHQDQKDTFRRFVISNKSTWSELETKIRSLYSIPASTHFILSYVDEDDDVITLSTDIELREVLSSREPTSTIKFHLKISAPDSLSDGEDSNEAWVFEGSNTTPQGTASVVNNDNVPQKNITSTTNQEAQSVESDSEEVPSNKKSLSDELSDDDDFLYDEGTSSARKNTMNEFYKSFDALGFVPTITPTNEDKGKQKEAIGESSSINVPSSLSLSSSSSSLLEQNQQPRDENQENQPPQEVKNHPQSPPTSQDQNDQPALSVYELADNFQKLIDQFKKDAANNPKYAQDSLSKLHQLIRSISAKLPQEEDDQHQQELRGQRYNVQQQNHGQSRRNDDFFDNPPPLFTRQPPIPGSFPTSQKPQSVQCVWAGQARPDSESYESHHNTRNGRRRRRRHRRHNNNRDYDEPKEETQETQEREEILEAHEEMLEAIEARERMRKEMQEVREEVREEVQEVREEEQELREAARELRKEVRELRKTTELSPYQEQIDILNNMGFWPDEDQYVELLTMYEGDVELVIECLLERQSQSQ